MRWVFLVLCLAVVGCGDDISSEATLGEGGGLIGEGEIPINVLGKPQLGDPRLESAQRIAFGPGGLLLVGDGLRDRIVAIETGEGGFGPVPPPPADLFGLRALVAELFGDGALPSEIVVEDVAVEPASRRIYLAAMRYHGGTSEVIIALFDHEGVLHRLATEQVLWAEARLPPNETLGSFVTGIVWQSEHLVVSASDGHFAPPSLFLIDRPIRHGRYAEVATPSTYLPASNKVQPALPIFAATNFGFSDESLLAAFMGSPVSRFTAEELVGGDIVGQTVFDFGSGREVRAMVGLDDGDRQWLWMSVDNAAFDGRILGYRVGGKLARGELGSDALAPSVLDFAGFPTHPEVLIEPALEGATAIAVRTTSSLVVLRDDSLALVDFN